MTTAARPTTPPPAPLPYASQAARHEVPSPAARAPENPDGPLMREDEATLWLCTGIVAAFVLLMVIVAATGGL